MTTQTPVSPTKGEQTAQRLLDAAESLFACHGYEGTTLRQITARAGIQEPGLYNHFSSKLALYEAVLHRALNPVAETLSGHLNQAKGLRTYTGLPSLLIDLMLQHPQMAALLQQAMHGDSNSVGNKLLLNWLKQLFNEGILNLGPLRPAVEDDTDQALLAINVIAIFNLTTGYFLSQSAFKAMAEGDLCSPDNIARQKHLLHRVMRAMLIS